MKKKLTFDKAYHDLSELVSAIESEDIKIDTLTEKVKQADELVAFCEERLRAIRRETQSAKKQS